MTRKSIAHSESKLDHLDESVRGARRVMYDKTARLLVTLPKKHEPSDFQPLAEAVVFRYDPKHIDRDSELAMIYISKYENKDYDGELRAADLNNLACAYLWQEKPDWEKAKQFFTEAHEKEPTNLAIQANKDKACEPAPFGLPKYYKIPLERAIELGQEFGMAVDVLSAKEISELDLFDGEL